MKVDFPLIDKYLAGGTTPEETVAVLAEIAVNPEMEEYLIVQMRLDYEQERLRDYGSFIPAGSMAADDDRNLCDFQCELFLLRREGIEVEEEDMMKISRRNYWLRDLGTPLFNMGRLLESKGFLVSRIYDADLAKARECLMDRSVIAVVNGNVLDPDRKDPEQTDFSNDANHAVVLLSISEDGKSVTLYNPACAEKETVYPLDRFLPAWNESSNYLVTSRRKRFPEEYDPQPVDVSDVHLDEDLLELTEMIAENAHDEWGRLKKASFREKLAEDPAYHIYAPKEDGKEQPGHNHYYVPYSMLSEEDKEIDRITAVNTIKLVKRLGYRLVNINNMYKCSDCGEVLEPGFCFCPGCGKALSWEDFR